MKKLISVLISVMMLFAAVSVTAVPAMAANSPQETQKHPVFSGEVNGNKDNNFTYTDDIAGSGTITIQYAGQGNVQSWQFPGLVEGVDYTIVAVNGNAITIKLSTALAQSDRQIVYNAILEAPAANEKDEDADVEDEDESSTSPKTGAVSAAGLAVAGAGLAILTALKKSEDAE